MSVPILDRPEVRQVLFHPRGEDLWTPPPPGVVRVAVEVEPGLAVGGRLYPAGAGAPAILYFHGNGEIAADYDDIAPLYTRLGATLLVADYRGYGTSGGQPTARHLVSDAVTWFDQVGRILADHGLAPGRLYVMGRSLGSAAAIEVAVHAQERVAGLIIESGFADTFGLLARLGLWLGRVGEKDDAFGNAGKMGQLRTPTLIIHGEQDMLIPADNGRELYRRSAAADKRLVLVPRAGHNDLLWVGQQTYFEAIQAFLSATPPQA